MQELLLKLGIPTYVYSVNTVLQGVDQEMIGDTMEVTVGHIYGMSVDIQGNSVISSGTPNITTSQAFLLYINIKFGQAIYMNNLRLNHLVYDDPSAVPKYNNPKKYFECNVPYGTDLKKSYYQNPTHINGANVALNLFYIDTVAYKNLLDSNMVYNNGKKPA